MAKNKKLKWKKAGKQFYESYPTFRATGDFERKGHEFIVRFKDWGERKFWLLLFDRKTSLYFKKLSTAKKVAQLIHND